MKREEMLIYLGLILPQMTRDGWETEYLEAFEAAIKAFVEATPDTERVNKDELALLRAKALVIDKTQLYYRYMTGAAERELHNSKLTLAMLKAKLEKPT